MPSLPEEGEGRIRPSGKTPVDTRLNRVDLAGTHSGVPQRGQSMNENGVLKTFNVNITTHMCYFWGMQDKRQDRLSGASGIFRKTIL